VAEQPSSDEPLGDAGLPARLREEVSRAVRHRLPLSLLVFRVEPPCEAPEARGELARAAALLARGIVRRSDVVGLLGCGQFGVVANAPSEGASALGEMLVRQLSAFLFRCTSGPVTLRLRCGHSSLGEARTAEDLLRAARAALEGAD